MDSSDWILIGTTLFLGFIALITPYLSEKIKRHFFAPKMKVTFNESPPCCLKTLYKPSDPSLIGKHEVWGVGDLWLHGGQPVFFFRFLVQNTGQSRLTKCEAVIEQLYIYDSADKPQKIEGFNDISLVWADSDKQFVIDIGPHRRKYCNLGHIASAKYQKEIESKNFIDIKEVQEDCLRFKFELAYSPNSQPNCLVPGKYAIKIGLYSDNVPKRDLFFQIAWS